MIVITLDPNTEFMQEVFQYLETLNGKNEIRELTERWGVDSPTAKEMIDLYYKSKKELVP